MKNSLLALFAAATVAPLSAAPPAPLVDAVAGTPAITNRHASPASIRVTSNLQLGPSARLQILRDANGNSVKKFVKGSMAITPRLRNLPAAAPDANGNVLSENFEHDGATPDGWAVDSKNNLESDQTWHADNPALLFMTGFEGDYAFYCPFNGDVDLNEWLVTPEIELPEGMGLDFILYADAVFFFSMDNVDWDTYEYIGDPVVIGDFKVKISADGGTTWNDLYSTVESSKDKSFEELLNESGQPAKQVSVSLAEYAGKKVKIAFVNSGKDTNSVFVDAVRVGYPRLSASYAHPAGTLFFGYDKEMTGLTIPVAVNGVNTPLTWTASSNDSGVDFVWSYMNNEGETMSADGDELTVTYHPDYTSEFTTRNNLFPVPEVTASRDGSAPGSFSHASYIQAGGRPQFEAKVDGTPTLLELGLMSFPYTDGLYNQLGGDDMTIPVLGHSPGTDAFWTDYTFNGDPEDGDYSKLISLINMYTTTEVPTVVRGLHFGAYADFADGAELTAEIHLADIDKETGGYIIRPTVLASAKSVVNTVMEESTGKDLVTIMFTFDKPVVLSSDVAPGYVVKIIGFNSPVVNYFSPFVGMADDYRGLAYGWIEKEICYSGNEPRTTLSPIAYVTGLMNSFAFVLDAELPWLTGPEEIGVIPAAPTRLVLDSFYDASELTVEGLPDGVSCAIDGRYDKCTATLTTTRTDKATADITFRAPGVELPVRLLIGTAAIDNIEAEAPATVAFYDLCGRRISTPTTPGIYIEKRADGSTVKQILR